MESSCHAGNRAGDVRLASLCRRRRATSIRFGNAFFEANGWSRGYSRFRCRCCLGSAGRPKDDTNDHSCLAALFSGRSHHRMGSVPHLVSSGLSCLRRATCAARQQDYPSNCNRMTSLLFRHVEGLFAMYGKDLPLARVRTSWWRWRKRNQIIDIPNLFRDNTLLLPVTPDQVRG